MQTYKAHIYKPLTNICLSGDYCNLKLYFKAIPNCSGIVGISSAVICQIADDVILPGKQDPVHFSK